MKTLEDYNFYIGSAKQASDFETTNKFIINHVKQTYTNYPLDISESLRLLTIYDVNAWRPTLIISAATDKTVKARENKENEMIYKSEVEEWGKRKRYYETNLVNAYALIWQRCTKGLKDRIERRPDFKASIYNRPTALLQAIKEHSTSYEQNKYPMATITDAMRAWLDCTQEDSEIKH